ncbi:hypothetical protein [Cupriavidus malaysiensis]|nr:hypothetical protein [Cupriavidus malaysiensis]
MTRFIRLQEGEEDEIKRILLAVAITTRVLDDGLSGQPNRLATPCGTLNTDTRRPEQVVDLSLREACNKIIHTNRMRLDMSENAAGRRYLNPTIYLYGNDLRDRPYKASLDVVAFAKCLSNCIFALYPL